jgi:hypothetical protein
LKEQALALGVRIQFNAHPRDPLREGVVATGPFAGNMTAVGMVFETDAADGAFGAFSDDLAPAGYAYLLVHQGRGTLAIYLFQDFHNEKSYRDRAVHYFSEKLGLRMENVRLFGGVGGFHLPRHACHGNQLFAGEAAGFQDAAWGFGMRHAVLSGHLAARAILSGMPGSYDRLWHQRLGGLMRAALVNRFLFSRLGNRGHRFMVRRLAQAPDGRAWLRSYCRPCWWKTAVYPLVYWQLRFRHTTVPFGPIKEGCPCTWCRWRLATRSSKDRSV